MSVYSSYHVHARPSFTNIRLRLLRSGSTQGLHFALADLDGHSQELVKQLPAAGPEPRSHRPYLRDLNRIVCAHRSFANIVGVNATGCSLYGGARGCSH